MKNNHEIEDKMTKKKYFWTNVNGRNIPFWGCKEGWDVNRHIFRFILLTFLCQTQPRHFLARHGQVGLWGLSNRKHPIFNLALPILKILTIFDVVVGGKSHCDKIFTPLSSKIGTFAVKEHTQFGLPYICRLWPIKGQFCIFPQLSLS